MTSKLVPRIAAYKERKIASRERIYVQNISRVLNIFLRSEYLKMAHAFILNISSHNI